MTMRFFYVWSFISGTLCSNIRYIVDLLSYYIFVYNISSINRRPYILIRSRKNPILILFISYIFFRYAYTLNKDAGVVTGLDGALQRIIINGNAIEDLIEVSKNSRGITKYVGPPCDDDKSQQNAKCMNGGVCTPFFRSYVCKCTKDYIGPKCEKSKQFIIYKSKVF